MTCDCKQKRVFGFCIEHDPLFPDTIGGLIGMVDGVLDKHGLSPWCNRCESAMVPDALGKLWCPWCGAVCESCDRSLRLYSEDKGKLQGELCSGCEMVKSIAHERDMQISWDNERAASMRVH